MDIFGGFVPVQIDSIVKSSPLETEGYFNPLNSMLSANNYPVSLNNRQGIFQGFMPVGSPDNLDLSSYASPGYSPAYGNQGQSSELSMLNDYINVTVPEGYDPFKQKILGDIGSDPYIKKMVYNQLMSSHPEPEERVTSSPKQVYGPVMQTPVERTVQVGTRESPNHAPSMLELPDISSEYSPVVINDGSNPTEQAVQAQSEQDWQPPGLWGYVKQGVSDVWDKNAPKSWKLAGEQLNQEGKALVNRNQGIIEQAKVEGKHLHNAMKKGVRNAYYNRQVLRDVATAALSERLRRKAIAEGRDPSKYASFWQVMKENRKEGVPRHQLMDLMIQNGVDWRLAFGVDTLDKLVNSDETIIKGLFYEPEKTIPAAIKGFTAIPQLPFTAMTALAAEVNRYSDKAFGNYDPRTSPSAWDVIVDNYNPYNPQKYQLHTQLLKAMTRPKGSEGMPDVWYDHLPLEWKRKIAESPGLLAEVLETIDGAREFKGLVKDLPHMMNARIPGLDFVDDFGRGVKNKVGRLVDPDDMQGLNQFVKTSLDSDKSYMVDGPFRFKPSRRVEIVDRKYLQKPKRVAFSFKTKGIDDSGIPTRTRVNVLYHPDEVGKAFNAHFISETAKNVPGEHLQHIGRIHFIDSRGKMISSRGNSIEISGLFNSNRFGNDDVYIFLRQNQLVKNSAGKKVLQAVDLSENEISKIFWHEIGHNVSFKSKEFLRHRKNLANIHSHLLKSNKYDSMFNGIKHYRNFKEFTAQCYMYAVVEPDRLKELNRFAKSIDKSFDLLTPFDEILKKRK